MEPSDGLLPSPNIAHILYILLVVGITIAVHVFSVFDLRGVGRIKRRRRIDDNDAEFETSQRPKRSSSMPTADRLELVPRADVTALTSALILFGVATAAFAGFLGPVVVSPLLSGLPLDRMTSNFTFAAPEMLGRVAQIVGAVCLVITALRMARAAMALAAMVLIVIAVHYAVIFVTSP